MVKVLGLSSPKGRATSRVLVAAYLLRIYLSINSLGFTVSLPSIMEDLGFIAFYPVLLVLNSSSMAVLALVGGKLIDILGVKRMTVLAVSGVSLAALGAAFAPNLPVFVAFYMVMACCHGTGITMPVAMICDISSQEERPHYMGLYSAANNVGLLVGPLLGGLITDTLGYRFISLFPLALSVTALFLVIRYYPEKAKKSVPVTFDGVGAALSSMAIAGFIALLNVGGKYLPWSSPVLWGGGTCRGGTGGCVPDLGTAGSRTSAEFETVLHPVLLSGRDHGFAGDAQYQPVRKLCDPVCAERLRGDSHV